MKKIPLFALTAVLPLSLATACLRAQVATAAAVGAMAAAPHLVGAVPAVLTGAVSSASAHAGTAVLAKAMSPFSLSNGAKLPAGSQLLGHVTEAARFQGHGKISSLGMMFDRIRTPDGQEQPISGGILKGIGGESKAQNDQQTQGSGGAQAQASVNGGGLLGGVVNGVGNTVGGVVHATGQLLGVVTGLPGVLLQADGTLAARNRDVEVPAGIQVNVQAAAGAQ